jgi:hypothetical protein
MPNHQSFRKLPTEVLLQKYNSQCFKSVAMEISLQVLIYLPKGAFIKEACSFAVPDLQKNKNLLGVFGSNSSLRE